MIFAQPVWSELERSCAYVNPVDNLINAVGGIAEMCRVFYNACIKQGFTQTQSMELTKQIPYAMFSQKPESRGEQP